MQTHINDLESKVSSLESTVKSLESKVEEAGTVGVCCFFLGYLCVVGAKYREKCVDMVFLRSIFPCDTVVVLLITNAGRPTRRSVWRATTETWGEITELRQRVLKALNVIQQKAETVAKEWTAYNLYEPTTGPHADSWHLEKITSGLTGMKDLDSSYERIMLNRCSVSSMSAIYLRLCWKPQVSDSPGYPGLTVYGWQNNIE